MASETADRNRPDLGIADSGSAFVYREGERVAFLRYRLRGNRLLLEHTEVPPELGGRGVGSALVTAGVERARAEGLDLIVACAFASAWLKRHPMQTTGLRVKHRMDASGG